MAYLGVDGAATTWSDGKVSCCFDGSKRNDGDASNGMRFADEEEMADESMPEVPLVSSWRMRERMKTMDVALVLCLNIGTDPPDVVRPDPCARKECWVDPFSMPANRALDTIGKTLQSQYERWQPRARYKQCLDPTVEDTRQLCASLRKHAKNDRVLFHYNGHGVPRPTPNGEVWVFNRSYTQYIPLLVYDLQAWIGTPSIYVFDCSSAGLLLKHFSSSAPASTDSTSSMRSTSNSDAGASSMSSANESIVLCACGPEEVLPTNPDLCADVFTSCLTTPITIALRWFISQNELSMGHLDPGLIDRIPGKLTDRKTPLGELNWIFTAVTDTIAWNVLPKSHFQKLFRHDLLIASLFRNFLLAERIMKSEGCTPCSLPALPPTHHHKLWQSWDLAAETCLTQLHRMANPRPQQTPFSPSLFFAEQLTAFSVWLQFGSSAKPPPQQLPMVLQVLLSQVHRLRALVLLQHFLDLGPWAVNLTLSVGIFPYVVKLLQSNATELRQVLVFIWAKILALDSSCQTDLVKDNGQSYFIAQLAAGLQAGPGQAPVSSDQKTMAAFVLSVICHDCRQGQKGCLSQYLHKICSNMLSDPDGGVRVWVALCLSSLCDGYEDGKRVAIEDGAPAALIDRLKDERPEVRAAACVALGSLLGFQFDQSMVGRVVGEKQVGEYLEMRAHQDLSVAVELLVATEDASPVVRREAVLAISRVVLHSYHQPKFEEVARHFQNRSLNKHEAEPRLSSTQIGNSPRENVPSRSRSFLVAELDVDLGDELVDTVGQDASNYVAVWRRLKQMQVQDPFPKTVNAVKTIVGQVNKQLLKGRQDNASTSTNSMQREVSVPDLPGFANTQSQPHASSTYNRQHSDGRQTESSEGSMRPIHSVGNFRAYEDQQTDANGSNQETETKAYRTEAYGPSKSFPASLQSAFYARQKAKFNEPMLVPAMDNSDPLNPATAARSERLRRYAEIRKAGEKLSPLSDVDTAPLSMPSPSNYSAHDFTMRGGVHGDRDEIRRFTLNLRQRAVLNNEAEMTSLLLFHPYETTLLVADQLHQVSLYNFEQSEQKLLSFENTPASSPSRLTALDWINADEKALLMCGSVDGMVRVYQGLHEATPAPGSQKLITAFNAVPDLVSTARGSGLVTTWQQDSAMLFAGGNSNMLRGWDLRQERCSFQAQTFSGTCVTSMASCPETVVSGFEDGVVSLFDPREQPDRSLRCMLKEHTPSWVVQTHMYAGSNELLTGTLLGEVKLWDLRNTSTSVKTMNVHREEMRMTALAVHQHSPIFASGSHNQFIKVFRSDGEQLALIRYHEGFLGERIGPVSCLAFHPNRLFLAAGATDSIVAIYSNDK